MIRQSRSRSGLITSAFVAMTVATLTVFAADVFVGTPPFNPPPSQQVTIDLLVDVGGDVLGSYFFEFQYDPAVVHVVSIGGGTTAEFSSPPTTNPGTFSSGTTPLAAAQGNVASPSGFIGVATVTLSAVGLPADSSDLDLIVQSLFDAQADELSATVFPSSLLVALPEVPPSLVFTSHTALDWSAAPDVTHYNVYRGTLRTGGNDQTFNHTCLAPDLTATMASDGSSPTAGQGFYYLIATERNGVEGPLGLTSAGQVRPNFFSCSSAPAPHGAVEGLPISLRVTRVQAAPSTVGQRDTFDDLALSTTGDVNGDGRLDDADAQSILESLVGLRPLSRTGEYEADADGNGRVDVADAQRVRQFLTSGRGRTSAHAGLSVVLGSADCSAVNFDAGLSIVRLRCLPEGYTAFELLSDLADGFAAVQRFDPTEGRYLTARVVDGRPEGDDFVLRPAESFMLDLSRKRTEFRPARTP